MAATVFGSPPSPPPTVGATSQMVTDFSPSVGSVASERMVPLTSSKHHIHTGLAAHFSRGFMVHLLLESF